MDAAWRAFTRHLLPVRRMKEVCRGSQGLLPSCQKGLAEPQESMKLLNPNIKQTKGNVNGFIWALLKLQQNHFAGDAPPTPWSWHLPVGKPYCKARFSSNFSPSVSTRVSNKPWLKLCKCWSVLKCYSWNNYNKQTHSTVSSPAQLCPPQCMLSPVQHAGSKPGDTRLSWKTQTSHAIVKMTKRDIMNKRLILLLNMMW